MLKKWKVTMYCLLILEHRTYWWRWLCICFSDAYGSVSSRIFLLWCIVPMGGVSGFFCSFFIYSITFYWKMDYWVSLCIRESDSYWYSV